jgi:CubicO group peptidase (beta-lactamase class C family)
VHSRRAFFHEVFGIAVGAAGLAACGRSSSDGATIRVTDPPESSTAPASTIAPTSATPRSSTLSKPSSTDDVQPASTIAVDLPWAGADFGELDRFIETTNGEAFVIVEGGVTIHEWYRTDAGYVRDIASAQKSVLSLLVGRAIADGLIGLDTVVDEVLGTGWTTHGDTAAITVRQLLSMTSGLDDELRVIAAPGTLWRYSRAFAQLFTVLSTVTGRPIDDVARDWLFDPAGAAGARFYERPASANLPSIGMLAGVNDLAAIGRLVLDATVPSLSSTWLAESFAPSQQFNPSYGYLWWLNGQRSYLLPGPAPTPIIGDLIPTGPSDLVAALGKDDQKLHISRELDLVVARLGGKADPDATLALSRFDAELWTLLDAMRR